MGVFTDISGQKFNRLLVLRQLGKRGKILLWECLCDCGKKTIVAPHPLKTNKVKSCGCLRKEQNPTLRLSHGMARKTPEYNAWCHIKSRCYNEKTPQFKDYGGRGITVCERWLNSFENFYADMGPRPSPEHSIDRKDNSKGYSPENCYWATSEEQNRNRRYVIPVVNIETGLFYDSIAEAAEAYNLSSRNIQQQIRLNIKKRKFYSIK